MESLLCAHAPEPLLPTLRLNPVFLKAGFDYISVFSSPSMMWYHSRAIHT